MSGLDRQMGRRSVTIWMTSGVAFLDRVTHCYIAILLCCILISLPNCGFLHALMGFVLFLHRRRAGRLGGSTYSKRKNSRSAELESGGSELHVATRGDQPAPSRPRSGACPASSDSQRPPTPRGAKLMPSLPTATVRRGGRDLLPEPTAPAGDAVPRGYSPFLFSCISCSCER